MPRERDLDQIAINTIRTLAPQIRRGGFVMNDNGEEDYQTRNSGYLDRDWGLTASNAFNPFVVTKNSQRLGDRFVEAVGAHLDRVFNPAKVNAGDSACP